MSLKPASSLIGIAGVQSADDVRRHAKPLIRYSPERRKLNVELRRYLYKNLYYQSRGERAAPPRKAAFAGAVPFLFETPEGNRRASAPTITPEAGLHRAVCDYIAGMTDRYAIQEHRRLCGDTLKFA